MTLNKETLAERLDGSEYPLRLDRNLLQEMKDLGLVVVYGASDDLMEFDGAIYDEAGAPDTIYIKDGELLHRPDCDCDQADKVLAADTQAAQSITCAQNAEPWPDAYWSYQTTIPHATFRIMEDGDVNCVAIVFSVHEMEGPEAKLGMEGYNHSNTSN